MLNDCAGQFSIFSIMCYPFLTLESFTDLCKSIYFSVDDYSAASATILHGGLYYLFLEYKVLGKDEGRGQQQHELVSTCKANLETCLNNLDLLLPATDENIYAMLLGVFVTVL